MIFEISFWFVPQVSKRDSDFFSKWTNPYGNDVRVREQSRYSGDYY